MPSDRVETTRVADSAATLSPLPLLPSSRPTPTLPFSARESVRGRILCHPCSSHRHRLPACCRTNREGMRREPGIDFFSVARRQGSPTSQRTGPLSHLGHLRGSGSSRTVVTGLSPDGYGGGGEEGCKAGHRHRRRRHRLHRQRIF